MADLSVAVRLVGEDAGLSKIVQNAIRTVGGLGKAATLGAAAGTVALSGMGIAATKMAGDLEQAVANISTIKPEIDTSAVFGALNEMSTRVPQSASQLGDSLYNVFSSIETTQTGALQLVEQFAKGAVGAQTDAQTFGTAVLGVMNAYGLAVEDAAHISDVFFNTVNKGVVTGQELAYNLGPVTQSAKAAGVELDVLGGLLAGVTKEGGPAAQNINNLNNFLQKVTTKDAQKEINALGVATKDQAGNFRPILDVLGDLKPRLEGMTESARANALQAIFPDAQARVGAQTILSQLDMVKAAVDENRAATGSAASAYEKMSATFNSQTQLLGNTFTSILTTIGANLLPSITPIVTAFSTALPQAFGAAQAVMMAFQVDAGALGLALDRIRAAFGDTVANALQPFLHGLMEAIPTIKAFAADPLAALQAGMGQVQEAMKDFAPTAQRIGGAVEAVAQAVGQLVPEPLHGMVTGLFESGTASDAANTAFTALTAVINGVSAAVETVVGWFQQNSGALAALNALIAAGAAAYVLMTAGTIAQTVVTQGVTVATNIAAAAQAAWNTVITANPIGIIVVLIAGFVAALITLYQTNEEARAIMDAAWLGIQQGITLAVQAVQVVWQTMQTTWETVSTAIGTALTNLQTGWSTGWTAMSTTLSSTWTTMTAAVRTAVNSIIGFINNLIGAWNALEFRIPGFSVELPSADVPGVGKVGGGTLGWGGVTVGTPDLPMIPVLDTGGVVTGPTLAALAMNNRPEAVVPLRNDGDLIDYDRLGATAARYLAAELRANPLVVAVDDIISGLSRRQLGGAQVLRI